MSSSELLKLNDYHDHKTYPTEKIMPNGKDKNSPKNKNKDKKYFRPFVFIKGVKFIVSPNSTLDSPKSHYLGVNLSKAIKTNHWI